ncbi:hypothetical protein [Streptomyces sp. NPDC001930]
MAIGRFEGPDSYVVAEAACRMRWWSRGLRPALAALSASGLAAENGS